MPTHIISTIRKFFIAIALFSIFAGERELYGEIAGSISWKKDYKAGRYTDPYDIKIDNDGYYVSIAFADDRTWLLKLDPETGDTVLSRFYNGHPYAFAIDDDNNYVIVATRGGYDIYIDAVITKVDSRTGDIIWQRIYGDNEIEDKLLDIAVLPNGDYIGVGLKEKYDFYNGRVDRLWIIYIDSKTGDTLYARRYDDLAFSSIGFTVTVSRLGNVYVGGRLKRTSQSPSDGFILKIDEKTGKIIWKKLVGSIKDDNVFDIMFDPSNRLVGVGSYVDPRKNEYVGWIFTMHPRTGKILGKRQFDGAEGPSETHFTRVAWNPQTKSYVVAGYFKSYNGENRKNVPWILNIEPEAFKVIWERRFERNDKKEPMIRAIDVDERGRTIVAGFDRHRTTSTWFIQLDGFGKNVFWLRAYGSIQRIDQIMKSPYGINNFFALTDTDNGLKMLFIEGNTGSVENIFVKKGEHGRDFDLLTDNTAILVSYKPLSEFKNETILRILRLGINKSKTIQEMKFKNLSPLTVKKINDTLIILVGADGIPGILINSLKMVYLYLGKDQKIKSRSTIEIPENLKIMDIDFMPEQGFMVIWGETSNGVPYVKAFDYEKQRFVLDKSLKDIEGRIGNILDITTEDDKIIVLGLTWKGIYAVPVLIELYPKEDKINVSEIEFPDFTLWAKLIYSSTSTYVISFVLKSKNSKNDVLHVVEFDQNLKPKRRVIYGVVNKDMDISKSFLLKGGILYIAGNIQEGPFKETVPYIMMLSFPLLNK